MANAERNSGFKEKLHRFSLTGLRLVLTSLLIVASPLIVILLGLVSAYRLLVFKVAKYFEPSLGKMVSSISNLFAAHDVYGNSYSVNVALHVVGNIDRYHLIHVFEKMLLLTKNVDDENKEPLLYPELRQRIVSRFGFNFWKNVEDFKVEDHIHCYNSHFNELTKDPDAPVTLEDIHKTIAKLGKTPYNRKRSPWAIYVVQNFKNEKNPSVKSAFLLRLHHCMFDGYSVMNLFGRFVDNGPLVLAGQKPKESDEEAKVENKLLSGLKLLLKPFICLFVGLYELSGQLLSFDNNELVKIGKSEFKSIMKFVECEPIPLEDLKIIKNHHKVTMSALIMTIIVRAIKNMMSKRNITPDKIHMTFPLPVIDHPDKLRNYFSGGIISFDLRIKDKIEALKAVEKKLSEFRSTLAFGLPEVTILFLRLLGSLPNVLVPDLNSVPLCSTLMFTSFPGPVDIHHFCGFPIIDATVGGSISKSYPIGSLCFSYNGVYKISLVGDSSIFKTQEEIEEIGQTVNKELADFLMHVKEETV